MHLLIFQNTGRRSHHYHYSAGAWDKPLSQSLVLTGVTLLFSADNGNYNQDLQPSLSARQAYLLQET